jgi:hypothetical protein
MVERASGLADELLVKLRAAKRLGTGISSLHMLAWAVARSGRGQELIDVLPKIESKWVRAAAAFAAGDLGTAADICASMGAVVEEAHDRLWLAEALMEQNRRPDADAQLQRALEFFTSVGASRYIRRAEGLRAATA